MAYNNGFPVGYQSYYPGAYQHLPAAGQYANQQQANSGIIWVQGEAGAKSYLVAPNTTVALWDSEKQAIYLKSADASGMPSIKTIDYTVRGAEASSNGSDGGRGEYVSKDDLKALQSDLDALRADLEKMKHAKVKLTRISEGEEDE